MLRDTKAKVDQEGRSAFKGVAGQIGPRGVPQGRVQINLGVSLFPPGGDSYGSSPFSFLLGVVTENVRVTQRRELIPRLTSRIEWSPHRSYRQGDRQP